MRWFHVYLCLWTHHLSLSRSHSAFAFSLCVRSQQHSPSVYVLLMARIKNAVPVGTSQRRRKKCCLAMLMNCFDSLALGRSIPGTDSKSCMKSSDTFFSGAGEKLFFHIQNGIGSHSRLSAAAFLHPISMNVASISQGAQIRRLFFFEFPFSHDVMRA